MAITTGQNIIATTTVNLRAGAGYDYAVVGTLKHGDERTVIGGPIHFNGLIWWQVGQAQWCAEAVNGKSLIVATGDLFARCIEFVLDREGGYVNDPNDIGGETNFGISKRSYPTLDIKNLTRQDAETIYRRDYWHASGADKQPWPMCLVVLDTAVLHGVARAKEWLQQSSNPWMYLATRLASYTSGKSWQNYGAGWTNRVVELMKVCGG